ncbi:MAG TPA: hypothetical protein ENN13_03215 [Candidatus Altiarchaeales archaeon]|nr:hypothetical protein [Candidatus Altiarchaeales archaeon]
MKSKIAGLLVLTILACGCIGGGGNDATTTTLKTSEVTPTTAKPATTTTQGQGVVDRLTDMAQAMASGGSYKCTYNYEGLQTTSWVMGEKFKSTSVLTGMEFNSISDGVWIYSWNSDESQGMKLRISDFQDIQEQDDLQDYPDMEEIARFARDVDCRPEALSQAFFTPPSNIEFIDVGEQMRQMQEMMQQYQQGPADNPCAMCDLIPDSDLRADCLQSCGA